MEVDDLKTNVKYIFNCDCGIDEANRWYKITRKSWKVNRMLMQLLYRTIL